MKIHLPRILALLLVLQLCPFAAWAGVPAVWPFRYLLVVDDEGDYYAGVRNAKKQKDSGEPVSYIEGYLKPTLLIKRAEESGFALFLMEFDRQGRLLDSKTRKPTPYRGVFEPRSADDKNVIVEVTHSADTSKGFIVGSYNRITNALCTQGEYERIKAEEENPPDPTEPEEYYSFYCMDWVAQMQSPKVKVIDVSSDADGDTSVGGFIGSARFEDKKKPVWGMYGGRYYRYYCFADCPAGKPGRVKWAPPPATRGADY